MLALRGTTNLNLDKEKFKLITRGNTTGLESSRDHIPGITIQLVSTPPSTSNLQAANENRSIILAHMLIIGYSMSEKKMYKTVLKQQN